MTLYELSQEYAALLDLAADPETDAETLADTLEALGGEIEEKADGYAMVIAELQNSAECIAVEVKRLRNRKEAIEKNISRMKDALQTAMVQTGKTKFKTDLFSFGISKNPPAVVVDADITGIPEEFLKFKEPEVDKAALKKALQAGVKLEGVAHLEQSEGLRIR